MNDVDPAIARKIVSAFNHHDKLVAALKGMVTAFNAPAPDPFVAFATLEKAKAVLTKLEVSK